MGNRLSKIYTKTGDQGKTALSDAERISKSDNIICAIGDIDELNSYVGLLATNMEDRSSIYDQLIEIQHILFNIGAQLSFPQYNQLTETNTQQLENWLDRMNDELKPLKEFILPGGHRGSALAHVCRSIARRSERQLVRLMDEQAVDNLILAYINRLSDYFFVLARYINKINAKSDVYWQSHRITG